MPRAACPGVDIWAAGTSPWMIPSLKENWAAWCPTEGHEQFQSWRSLVWHLGTLWPAGHCWCHMSMWRGGSSMWWTWDPWNTTFQNSILSPFFPLFSLFMCCAMRSPEGFVPGEQREHIHSPVTHRLRAGVREGAHPSPHQPGCSLLHLG